MHEPPNDPDATVVGAIAHEVNSPLAVVLANLDLAVEALARLRASASSHLATDGARAWLDEHLREAESCLADARASAAEIHTRLARRTAPPSEPASRAPVAPPSEPAARAPVAPPSAPSPVRVPARILVVDDQESVGRAVERVLRGYDVIALVDPREALARITGGERFAVVLCDLMMPEMTGAVLYDRVRAIDPEQAERMVFITGGAITTETRTFARNIGRTVLLKPFVVDELRAVVARVAAQFAQTTP